MESSYSIDPDEFLVRLKVWGELTADGLMEVMRRVGMDPRHQAGMPVVADLREAHGNWDYSEIQRFRDFVAQLQTPEVRWAAVVVPGTLVAVAHVLIVISEAVGTRIRMQLFEDPQSALHWVRGQLD
jgi:hypothetical protein